MFNQNLSGIQSELDFVDVVTITSFVLQLKNQEELHRQSSNDDIIEHLHNDIVALMEENRILSDKVIKQNDEIIRLLKGESKEHEL